MTIKTVLDRTMIVNDRQCMIPFKKNEDDLQKRRHLGKKCLSSHDVFLDTTNKVTSSISSSIFFLSPISYLYKTMGVTRMVDLK